MQQALESLDYPTDFIQYLIEQLTIPVTRIRQAVSLSISNPINFKGLFMQVINGIDYTFTIFDDEIYIDISKEGN